MADERLSTGIIMTPLCAFQNGSYPCGKKTLPDCKLCHKVREATTQEIFDEIEKHMSMRTIDGGLFISGVIAGAKYRELKSRYLPSTNTKEE